MRIFIAWFVVLIEFGKLMFFMLYNTIRDHSKRFKKVANKITNTNENLSRHTGDDMGWPRWEP